MNSKQTVCVTWFCVLLLLSCQFTNIDARKQRGTTKRTNTGSHVTRHDSSDNRQSNAENTKLSYAPPPPQPPPVHHAPAATQDAGKPAIGWNPDGNVKTQSAQNTNAAPYPHQPQQSGPPPAYSPPQQSGPPPPYSPPYQQQGVAPPQYSGAPAGGFPQQQQGFAPQQGAYPQQGGFHQQQGFAPQQGAYPQQGGIPQQQGFAPQQGGYPQQQGYPAGQPTIVVQQQPQSSGGSGVQTALLAGVGGLALYGALKPSDEKTIIINNHGESSTPSSAAPSATTPVATSPNIAPVVTPVAPMAPAADAPVPLAPFPVPLAPMPSAVAPTDNGTSVTPVAVLSSDSTTVSNTPAQPMSSYGSTPLAPYPVYVTMAPSDIPPYSGSSIQYSQIPLASSEAPFQSSAPLAQYPSTSGVVGAATEVSIPVANTHQNLQAQSALKSGAVPCTLVAINFVIIPMLTLLMA